MGYNFMKEYISIHRELFLGIYDHAGKFRDYNMTKKEWILDGDTVFYGTASEIQAYLEDIIEQEKSFSYNKEMGMYEKIEHLADFISRLWQIHAFGEGNTEATAVFLMKYLKYLGFHVEEDVYEENKWYFRNALVRANYNDLKNNICRTTEYLELFLRNMILGEKNELKNRYMHI